MKECSICKEIKNSVEFYSHPATKDRLSNKCKDCCKKSSKKNYYKKSEEESFMESERLRNRDKYKRLGRKTNFPDIISHSKNIYVRLNKILNIPKGFECHHWSYEKQNIKDVFILKMKEHRRAHVFLKRDLESVVFSDLEGNILDTRKKHFNYLISKGIKF